MGLVVRKGMKFGLFLVLFCVWRREFVVLRWSIFVEVYQGEHAPRRISYQL